MDAQEIRALRKALGLTQKNFAKLVGVSHQAAHEWEAQDRRPSGLALKELLKIQKQAAKKAAKKKDS